MLEKNSVKGRRLEGKCHGGRCPGCTTCPVEGGLAGALGRAVMVPLPRILDRSLRIWLSVLGFPGDLFYEGCLTWRSQGYLNLHRTDGGRLSLDTRLQPCFLPRHISLSNRLQPRAHSMGAGTRRKMPREAAIVST